LLQETFSRFIKYKEDTMTQVIIRQLREEDVPGARRIFSLAFGTFIGVPEPENFWSDIDYIGTRSKADPSGAFAAEVGGNLVGSNIATNWGSVGFFGPLTVNPDHWDRGIGSRLMEPVMELFSEWNVRHTGLFTFAHSPKHMGLYQKYGFWPRFLTAIMSKAVQPGGEQSRWSTYSKASESEQESILRACRGITDKIYDGFDVGREVRAVQAQRLGDTVLLWDRDTLVGFGVCHCGPGTEAGTDTCLIKVGAIRPGSNAGQNFDELLDACEAFSSSRGLSRLSAGTNLAREDSYLRMRAKGFRTDFQGVAMQRYNDPGYNRADVYVIDDWR
jgi:GNAT superfamily N-acetyltransferase